ncbi:MAG TPA: TonB-dependent receptor [Steroidobacteraceae bacterium]|nr:TonB-dependent receptor [Steroidobacteraceae bacterium]
MTETIVVTGSRILRRDAVAESPLVTVDQESLLSSGFTTVEHYLNTLPQVVPGVSSQSNNPSLNGRAQIDLRGLGANRNLVLIDGRRAMGGSAGGSVVDINTIPAALVDRVEVITGGAAMTYGPDAVAGVVNFIMKKDFDGVAANSSYNLTEQGDGQEWSADLTFGGRFAEDRGTAVFNASYFNREDMYKGARDFAAQASNTTSIFPGGSWVPGTNTPSTAAVAGAFGANTCNNNGGAGGFGFNPDGSLFCTGVSGDPTRNAVGFTGPDSYIATNFYPDLFSYNFEPDNILVLPMERWSLYSNIAIEMSEHFQPYVRASYTNYNALQELAATPAGGTTGFTVPVTNPFIPTQLAGMLTSRVDNPATALNETTAPFSFAKRFSDLGGRTGYNTHDVWQLTAGAEGSITEKWRYDVYANYGRSVLNEIQGGNVRRDRTQALLNAADGGASLCAGGLNLFGNAPISDACQAYISLEAKNLTVSEQHVIEAVFNGELFDMPAGTVQTALGVAYRDLSFDFKPDSGLQPGLVAGFNQQLPVSGELDFTDVFVELAVPLLKELPGIQKLDLITGVRTTDNNLFGKDETWKANLDWTINDWARFRGGVQHAVRSPNIAELFAPQLNNFPTGTGSDPCNTTGTIAAQYRNGPNGAQVQALCAAQSAAAGLGSYVQPSGQFNGITGGNPNLTPETADSFTAGFVVSSPFDAGLLERLSFSVDYWSIDVEDVIAAVNAVTIVQRCYNRDNANPSFDINNAWCAQFNRDANNGGVIELQQLSRNQSFINTSGIDLTTNWGFGVGAGNLDFHLVTTWVEKFETQTTTVDPVYDFVGSIGAVTATATPKWKGTLMTSYSRENLQAQMAVRYIDSMIHANVVTGSSPLSNTGVAETWYLDLSGRYDLTESVTFRLGVNNLLDQEPRLYSPNVQANTDPSTYDVLGRRYFIGVNMRM